MKVKRPPKITPHDPFESVEFTSAAPPSRQYLLRSGRLDRRRVRPTETTMRKVVPVKPQKPDIPEGKRMGFLLVGNEEPCGRVKITCDCGYSGRLRLPTVAKLLKEAKGCQTKGCGVNDLNFRLWSDPVKCLKMQLFVLASAFGRELISRWGGTLDDEFELGLEEAYANFCEDELGGAPPEEAVWISKVVTSLPYLPGNILLSRAAPSFMARIPHCQVDVGAGRLRFSELRALTGKSESEILESAFELKSFEKLLVELL